MERDYVKAEGDDGKVEGDDGKVDEFLELEYSWVGALLTWSWTSAPSTNILSDSYSEDMLDDGIVILY